MERFKDTTDGQNNPGLWDVKTKAFIPDPGYLLRMESKRAQKNSSLIALHQQILLENIPQALRDKPYVFGSLIAVRPENIIYRNEEEKL